MNNTDCNFQGKFIPKLWREKKVNVRPIKAIKAIQMNQQTTRKITAAEDATAQKGDIRQTVVSSL